MLIAQAHSCLRACGVHTWEGSKYNLDPHKDSTHNYYGDCVREWEEAWLGGNGLCPYIGAEQSIEKLKTKTAIMGANSNS